MHQLALLYILVDRQWTLPSFSHRFSAFVVVFLESVLDCLTRLSYIHSFVSWFLVVNNIDRSSEIELFRSLQSIFGTCFVDCSVQSLHICYLVVTVISFHPVKYCIWSLLASQLVGSVSVVCRSGFISCLVPWFLFSLWSSCVSPLHVF